MCSPPMFLNLLACMRKLGRLENFVIRRSYPYASVYTMYIPGICIYLSVPSPTYIYYTQLLLLSLATFFKLFAGSVTAHNRIQRVFCPRLKFSLILYPLYDVAYIFNFFAQAPRRPGPHTLLFNRINSKPRRPRSII